MKKPKSRRGPYFQNMKSQPDRHSLQQDETPNVQSEAQIVQSELEQLTNSPWVIEQYTAIISDCSPSQLEEIQHCAESKPHMVVVAQMAAAALQRLKVTGTYAAESQPSDGLRETDAPQAPDEATMADTTHNNDPSFDFRTGAELTYHRSLDRGGPSAKAEGKQPKK